MFHVVWLAKYKQLPPKLFQMRISETTKRNNQNVQCKKERAGESLYVYMKTYPNPYVTKTIQQIPVLYICQTFFTNILKVSNMVLSVVVYPSPTIFTFYRERYWGTQKNHLFVVLMDVKRFANRKVELKFIREYICHRC